MAEELEHLLIPWMVQNLWCRIDSANGRGAFREALALETQVDTSITTLSIDILF